MLHSNSAHNLFRVCSNTTCIYFKLILHTDPYTSMTFSGKQLPGSQETFPWHLIPAPRNHILEKGNQINPSFKVLKKIKLTVAKQSGPLDYRCNFRSNPPGSQSVASGWSTPCLGCSVWWSCTGWLGPVRFLPILGSSQNASGFVAFPYSLCGWTMALRGRH